MPPASARSNCAGARQLLTDGQIEATDRPSLFGRCHAQMLCGGLTSTDEPTTGPRSDSSAGPRPERGGKNRSHGGGERRVSREGRGAVGGLILHSSV